MPDFISLKMDFSHFKEWINSQGEEKRKKCSDIVVAAILSTEHKAKSRVPVHNNYLKPAIHNSIAADRLGGNVAVLANRKYAPYVEFGTGSGVDVPSYVLETFGVDSMQWKGQGIRQVNRRAKAYLFNSAKEEYDNMIRKLNEIGFK